VRASGGGRPEAESCGGALEVFRTPAVSQKQRGGDQPWVLAGRQAGHTADEYVELLADVEFLEQCVEQCTRPGKNACAEGQRTHFLETVIVSPTSELEDLVVPVR
jgi:hypothetical protein